MPGPATTSRTAEIHIQDQVTFDDKVVTVTQEGYRYTIMPQTTTFEIPNYEADAKRYFEVKVKANTNFSLSAPGASWITVPGEKEEYPSVYFFKGDRGVRPREFTVRVEWAVNTDASKTDPRKPILVRRSSFLLLLRTPVRLMQTFLISIPRILM